MRVLVYGATGSQGGPVVPRLLARGHTPVVVTRSLEKAEPMRVLGAELALADMSDAASLSVASVGADAVALMVPAFIPNPIEAPQYFHNALAAAKDAGAKLVVYNTSGPVILQRIGNPIYDTRLDLIAALRQSGVPSIIIQPTAYMENLLGPWTRPGIVERDELAYPVPEHIPIGWIATDDVAAFVAAALERPDLAGEHLIVSGEENLTGPELAERFTRGLRRSIRYREMPLEEFGAVLDATFGPGAGAGGIAGYEFQRRHADLIPMWTDMASVLAKLPVRLTSAETWAGQHALAFALVANEQRVS